MVVVGSILELLLWFYIVLLLARLVADWVQMFAHSWQPRGPVLVILEVVYSLTDPPMRLVRRLVPPLRLGGMALDLSILIVLLVCYVLLILNRNLLLQA
ncbi:MAG: YggT family protein [Nocardioidaceae bacterium]|nr:YggT family protein [Nocardioidaceae bacterium]MDX6308234.1 YggT family protein [Nocardioidaceae bacterium]